MTADRPNRTDVFGYYRVRGTLVTVRPGHPPETWDGHRIDWMEWAAHAVRITREEYLALVRVRRRDDPLRTSRSGWVTSQGRAGRRPRAR